MSSKIFHSIPFERLKLVAAKVLPDDQSDNESIDNDTVLATDESDDTNEELREHSLNNKRVPSVPKKVNAATHNLSKNRKKPFEVSSRAPVSAPRFPPLSRGRPQVRDPRFSDLSGTLNTDMFSKAYEFCDELQRQEKHDLIKTLKTNKNKLSTYAKDQLKRELDKMKSLEYNRRALGAERQLKKQLTTKEKESILQTGKQPYVHSHGSIKRLLKEQKYKKLENSGQLNKYLIRKNKKQTQKDRMKIPFERRSALEINES